MEIIKSFKYAIKGIIYAIRNERNMRIHTLVSLCVFIFSLFFNMNAEKYVLLFLTCTLVMTLEMINSALENFIDLCVNDYNSKAKAAKDIAAGAVFIAALISIVVGVLFFSDVRGYINLWNFLCKYPYIVIFAVMFAVCGYFYVFMGPVEMKNKIKSIIKYLKNKFGGKNDG